METNEKKKEEIEEGLKEENVYSEEGAELLEEEDGIDEMEEGLAEGYESKNNPAECVYCHKILTDEDFIEEEIDGEYCRFCSTDHAEKYKKYHKQ